MKKLLLLTAVLAAGALCGCEKEEAESTAQVSDLTRAALAMRYPDAVNVVWEFRRGYAVAEFDLPAARAAAAVRNAAWFDQAGVWYMTETEMSFDALPEAVRTAFLAGRYAAWRIEEIDRIERAGAKTLYVIEAEGYPDGIETEADLYYLPDGILVKEVLDADDNDYGDCIAAPPIEGVEEFVRTRYPDARILDIDREDGMIEVEILDGTLCREVLFDAAGRWILTKTELDPSHIPDAVMRASAASEYAAWHIDDVDHFLTAEGKEYYRFELESAGGEVRVEITPEGALSVGIPD